MHIYIQKKLNKPTKCIVSSILLIGLLAITGCNIFSNTLVLNGRIESTQININSEVSGKVNEVNKQEGAEVKKGDSLVIIDKSSVELEIKQAEINIQQLAAKLIILKSSPRLELIQQSQATVDIAKAKFDELKKGTNQERINQAQIELDYAKKEYEYCENSYKNVNKLYKEDVLTEQNLADAQLKLWEAKSKLDTATLQVELRQNETTTFSVQSAKASYEQALAQFNLLKKGPVDQEIKVAELELENAKLDLEKAKLNLLRFTAVSPINGTFIVKNVNVGDTISTGMLIGKVCDLSDLWAKVYINQKDMDLISLNQIVELKSISLPEDTIKGKIVFIASQSEYLPEDIDKNEAQKSTVFEVKIKIMDNIKNLKPGMTVDAYIPKE